jgi:aminoglycoside phosphotransferase (APT) family kinase protein
LSWQITPIALTRAITNPDPAAAERAFDAMMEMKKIDTDGGQDPQATTPAELTRFMREDRIASRRSSRRQG